MALADVTAIPDFESLCELMQEHCQIQNDAAVLLLKRIAEAVFGDCVPIDVSALVQTDYRSVDHSTVDREDELQFEHQFLSPAIISPLLAGNMLPENLLEEEYNDDDDGQDDTVVNTGGESDSAFPPLGALSDASSLKTTTKKGKLPPTDSKAGKLEKSAAADELAATLFRPSRSRQSSVDETIPNFSASIDLPQPPLIPELPLPLNPYKSYSAGKNAEEQQQQQEQHHIRNTAEILRSMHVDLSEDAAYAASVLAGADVNVAQHVVEQALAQLPVCRHLLADGCYRADCSFSHDIDSHTCLFWLRTRCGKGASQCRFLHGFAEKLLENLPEHLYYSDDNVEHHSAAEYYRACNYDGTYVNNTDYSAVSYGSSGVAPANSSWIPSPPPSNSFANIASQGYDTRQSFASTHSDTSADPVRRPSTSHIPTATIPQDLWNAHENRDATAFYIADPIERYHAVTAALGVPRDNVIDLHFQSLKTFPVVLDTILPEKLQLVPRVWIVTGTGHHVGRQTHQKSGAALEAAVLDYLLSNYTNYEVSRGRDRNGQGGAVLVQLRR